MQELKFRRCCGCGRLAHNVNLLVAIMGDTYLCDECVIIAVGIVATEAKETVRIQFVDMMNATMKGPNEIVEKWKEIREKKALEQEYKDRD